MTASPENKLLVITPERIQVIGEAGVVKESLPLPLSSVPPIFEADLDGFNESASGKTLELWQGETHLFLRTDSLALIAKCSEDQVLAFNDFMQIINRAIPQKDVLVGSSLCGHSGPLPWHGNDWGNFVLLDDSSLLSVGRDSIRLWSKSGDLLWTQHLARHMVSGTVTSSKDGGRFAIDWREERGGSALFDTDAKVVGRQIAVYDVHTGKSLGIVSTPKQGIDGFALSPKGDLLAIRYNGILEIWKI